MYCTEEAGKEASSVSIFTVAADSWQFPKTRNNKKMNDIKVSSTKIQIAALKSN